MGEFNGALKNLSIGVASRNGKAWIHSVVVTNDPIEIWSYISNQNGFLESMAEADKSVIDFFKPKKMLYINIAYNLSIDCDASPSLPEMEDMGIYASADPVAINQ